MTQFKPGDRVTHNPTGAERIWAFHDGPFVGYFVGCEERGTNVAEYVRADIADAEIARLRVISNHVRLYLAGAISGSAMIDVIDKYSVSP